MPWGGHTESYNSSRVWSPKLSYSLDTTGLAKPGSCSPWLSLVGGIFPSVESPFQAGPSCVLLVCLASALCSSVQVRALLDLGQAVLDQAHLEPFERFGYSSLGKHRCMCLEFADILGCKSPRACVKTLVKGCYLHCLLPVTATMCWCLSVQS